MYKAYCEPYNVNHMTLPEREDESDPTDCPHCKGEGYFYYNEDGEEIPRIAYDLLPESEIDDEKCDKCNGTGIAEEEEETHPGEWEW